MVFRSGYNVNKVPGLQDSENRDDFGLVESEDSDCNDEEVRNYLPKVQHEEQKPSLCVPEIIVNSFSIILSFVVLNLSFSSNNIDFVH